MTSTMLDFLVANIKRLPVIASQDQEFWLAATLSANDALRQGLLLAPCPADPAYQVRASVERVRHLHQQATRKHPSTPALRQFLTEALHARKQITTLRTSKVVEHLTTLSAKDDVERVFRIAQAFALIPQAVLAAWESHEREHHEHPNSQHLCAITTSIDANAIRAEREAAARTARDTFITGYLRYSLRVARKYVNRGLEYEDLVQEASIGLLIATEKYDYLTHPRFANFATTWMWQHLTRAIANDSRLVRLPVHLNHKLDHLRTALKGAIAKQERKHTHALPLAATLKRLGHDPDETITLLGLSAPALAFDEKLPGMRTPIGSTLIATPFLDDQKASPNGTSLTKVLASLSPVQERVLRLRFGIDGPEHTLEEIGTTMGVTRERIRQIEKAALEWLRSPAARAKFRNHPDSQRREPYVAISARQHLARALARNMQDGAWRNHPDHEQEERIETTLALAFGSRQINVRQPVTIKGQLLQAFGNAGTPLHTSTLASRIRALLPLEDHQDTTLYSVMIGNPDLFTLLGNGVFTLTDYDARKSVLPYCPSIRPDGALTTDGLVSLLAALHTGQTYHTLITTIVRTLGITPPGADWYRQNLARLLYTLGIIDHVLLRREEHQPVRYQHPDTNAMLACVTERVAGMTIFWHLLATCQPITSAALSKEFARHYALGEYDTTNRFSLLLQLGGVRRLENGAFVLTETGWQATSNLPVQDDTPALVDTFLDEHERETQDQELDDLFTALTTLEQA